jgi:putative FmdB family regulatory protein
MPVYEYVCDHCDTRFEELRPSTRMDEPASCPTGHSHSRRVLSTFSALSRDAYGEAPAPIGGGGCGGGCSGCSCGAN